LIAFSVSDDFDGEAFGTENQATIFKVRHDVDPHAPRVYIVHAVFEGSVSSHVVHNPAAADHHPVPCLLDAFHVFGEWRIGRCRHAVDLGTYGMPGASEVWSVRVKRGCTSGEDRSRHLFPIALRRVGNRDLVDVHQSRSLLSRADTEVD
tara:strand:+ start:1440 stop:1889 length:450 start_codon:yes stop_codon:yes gene_type:complete